MLNEKIPSYIILTVSILTVVIIFISGFYFAGRSFVPKPIDESGMYLGLVRSRETVSNLEYIPQKPNSPNIKGLENNTLSKIYEKNNSSKALSNKELQSTKTIIQNDLTIETCNTVGEYYYEYYYDNYKFENINLQVKHHVRPTKVRTGNNDVPFLNLGKCKIVYKIISSELIYQSLTPPKYQGEPQMKTIDKCEYSEQSESSDYHMHHMSLSFAKKLDEKTIIIGKSCSNLLINKPGSATKQKDGLFISKNIFTIDNGQTWGILPDLYDGIITNLSSEDKILYNNLTKDIFFDKKQIPSLFVRSIIRNGDKLEVNIERKNCDTENVNCLDASATLAFTNDLKKDNKSEKKWQFDIKNSYGSVGKSGYISR